MDRAQRDPSDVVAGLLGDERFLAACAQRDMGALFRLLNRRGISTRRIASAVDISQGRLYDYMNGKSRVEKLIIFEQIADAFHIPGRLLGLAPRSWEPTAMPAPEHPTPVSVDGDDVAAMDAFRNADRQTGGTRLYGAVVRHLTSNIAPRLVDADSNPQVFAAAAALTEMAGWMAHDSGRDDLAERHFTRALPLARTSGDHALAANIAASSSHLALQTGDPAAAAHWAGTGLDILGQGTRIPPLTARLHTMKARALAAASQAAPAVWALDQAHQILATAAEAEHPWLSPFDAAALASESALVHRDLHEYDTALEHAEQAIALRETGRARSLAFSRITLVGIHVHRHELDAALRVGHDLLTADPALGSVRVIHQLDTLKDLLVTHRGYPPVRDFLARFADVRRARMLLLADIVPPPREGTAP
ncbi:helix-turn-helix transcriptional regulator [Streptomyces crystallinus]|uniref:Uncharacterized protein n=1 Tax=Streptomyces crystallinus TaxID=68191 RepID=A0ABN1GWA1_9ACTN